MIRVKGVFKYPLQSIGTSNNKLQVFLSILKRAGTRLIVDLRSRPQSQWFPHFNQKALRNTLSENNIGYRWMGEKLGGFQEGFERFTDYIEANPGDQFTQGIRELVNLLLDTEGPVALMCSERDVSKCHRNDIIEYLRKNLPKSKKLIVTYLQMNENDLKQLKLL